MWLECEKNEIYAGSKIETTKDALNRVTQTAVSTVGTTITNNYNYKSYFDSTIVNESATVNIDLIDEKTINSSYTKDDYGKLYRVTVKDNNNNGHIVEYTYFDVTELVPSGGNEEIIFPLAVTPPGGLTTRVIGSTALVSTVKTYKVENNALTLESTKDVEYDSNGNIIKYGSNTYVYDGLGRLIRENNQDLNKTYLYAYDTRGNLLSKTPYNYTTSGTLTANGTAQTFTYDNDDKIIGYTYDSAGNITSYNNKTLTWQGKELKQVNYNNNELTQLNYDALGNRHSKITEEYNTYYYYDGANLSNQFVYDKYGDEKCVISFLYNQQGVTGFYIIESIGNNYGGLYTFRKNIFGDITDIYQGTTRVAKYKYDAWGNCTVCNSDGTPNTSSTFIGNINPFRYRGYYWDKELGLYYLHSRYYDPAICRFISLDDVDYLTPDTLGGLNLYSYCNNNPIMYADPSGHIAISTLLIGMAIGFGAGFAISGGFEIAKQAYNGGDWNWDVSTWNWGQIGLSALGGGVAGAISSISFGSGVVGYLTTFATGGIGSVLGGMISGSVTDLQSGLIAFGVGAVANVAARGITALINKGVSAGAQKALNSPIFDDMTLGDLVGSGIKNNEYAPAYNKFLKYAGNLLLKANGQWARSLMYSFANAGISSLLSGWY